MKLTTRILGKILGGVAVVFIVYKIVPYVLLKLNRRGNKNRKTLPAAESSTVTTTTIAATKSVPPPTIATTAPSSSVSTTAAQNTKTEPQQPAQMQQQQQQQHSQPHVEQEQIQEQHVISKEVVACVRKPAPHFSATAVVDGAFKTVSLSDYRGKYLVILFYPRDFTFVCPTEIIAFSDRIEEFRKLGCEVIAASVDSHFTHLAWTKAPRSAGGLGPVNFPLLSDINLSIAKSYGVLTDAGDVSLRGLFIIDGNGIVRQATINDLPVGRSVDEVLRLVAAFKFTDEHGEVCPANWKPGDLTMKPNPRESQVYFQAVNKD